VLRVELWFCRLAALQARYPRAILGMLFLTCLPAAWGALHLELRSDWTELLPENQRSIADLRRVEQRFGSTGSFTVVLEGEDPAAMERLADALGGELARLPRRLVRAVDLDLRAERAFFSAHRHLFMELPDLLALRDQLQRLVAERKAAALFDLGLDEEGVSGATAADTERALRDLEQRYASKLAAVHSFPSGYYVGERGRLLALFVRTARPANDLAATAELERRIRAIVERTQPRRFHRSIRVSFTGDVLTARAEHDALRQDLWVIAAICGGLILGSIYLFYFEVRAILVLGAGVLVGVLWTFGLAYLRIGYLSTATAFLASIVPGNGINSGLILIARFLEERRPGKRIDEALGLAATKTWAATLSAACAAALAYGALMFTEFRGFNHFGFIGSTGMLLCWVSTYLAVPPLLALTSSWQERRGVRPVRRGGYGRPFLFLAQRAPRATIVGAVLLAALGAAAGYLWISGDPFEYDFRKLRNEASVSSGVGRLQERVLNLLHGRRQGMVVLADRPAQVPMLISALDRLRRAASGGAPPVGEVRSIQNLVPPNQESKTRLYAELTRSILPHLDPETRRKLKSWLPPADLRPITIDQVPAKLLRPYQEKDGRLGLVLYVEPPRGVSLWDGRQLLRFAAAVRAIRLESGEVVHSSGRAVIFADMLAAILHDGPRLTLLSLGAVLLLVLASFRKLPQVAAILFTLLVGMGWMIGLAAASGMRLNFLNFIAIPITFGIGVDYAVNMVRRYAEEGWAATPRVLLETGGAVILCSLTTIWGYLSLLSSDNQALRSFGKLAALGELTCLTAAVLVLPGLATLSSRRRSR